MTWKPAGKKQWRSSHELAAPRNTLGRSLNRLMVLEYVWNQLVGNKGKFWVLHAVKRYVIRGGKSIGS